MHNVSNSPQEVNIFKVPQLNSCKDHICNTFMTVTCITDVINVLTSNLKMLLYFKCNPKVRSWVKKSQYFLVDKLTVY